MCFVIFSLDIAAALQVAWFTAIGNKRGFHRKLTHLSFHWNTSKMFSSSGDWSTQTWLCNYENNIKKKNKHNSWLITGISAGKKWNDILSGLLNVFCLLTASFSHFISFSYLIKPNVCLTLITDMFFFLLKGWNMAGWTQHVNMSKPFPIYCSALLKSLLLQHL